MLCRSRCYFAGLISSLALVVSLGAATEVVANSSTSRYRTPRSHRIVREIDAHGFEIVPDIAHGSRLAPAKRLKDPDSRPVPATVSETDAFSVEFPSSEVHAVVRSIHRILRASIPLSRGPPLAWF